MEKVLLTHNDALDFKLDFVILSSAHLWEKIRQIANDSLLYLKLVFQGSVPDQFFRSGKT